MSILVRFSLAINRMTGGPRGEMFCARASSRLAQARARDRRSVPAAAWRAGALPLDMGVALRRLARRLGLRKQAEQLGVNDLVSFQLLKSFGQATVALP